MVKGIRAPMTTRTARTFYDEGIKNSQSAGKNAFPVREII